MFYQPAPHFAVEAVQHFGTNFLGFQILTGEQRCYIVGCYLAPYNTSSIENVVAVLKEWLQGAELLVAGDFNAKLSETEDNPRGEDIPAEMAAEGLEDISVHFLPRRSSW